MTISSICMYLGVWVTFWVTKVRLGNRILPSLHEHKTKASMNLWITLENIYTILWIQFEILYIRMICDHVYMCSFFSSFFYDNIWIQTNMCISFIRIYFINLKMKSYFYWKIISRSRKCNTFSIVKHSEEHNFFIYLNELEK